MPLETESNRVDEEEEEEEKRGSGEIRRQEEQTRGERNRQKMRRKPVLGSRYKPVSFGAEKRPGSRNRCARMHRDRAESRTTGGRGKYRVLSGSHWTVREGHSRRCEIMIS